MQNNFYKQSDLSLCPIYPSWTPSAQVPPVLDKEMLVSTHTALGHPDQTGFRISYTSTLVQQTRSSSRSPTASPGTHPVLLHRCISDRMGSQLADLSSLRTVVTSRVLTTHQLAGTGSNTISHTSVGTSVAQSDCSNILRQQHSSCIHSQTRGNSFYFSVQQDIGNISPPGSVCDSSHSNPSSRSPECDSGHPVSNQQSQPHGVMASRGNLTQFVLCLQDSSSGHVRHCREQGDPILYFTYSDSRAWEVDALFISWDSLDLVYAFPPAPIVSQTLQKIRFFHGTTVTLIASQHPPRPWHPLLLQLSRRPHIRLTDVALYQYIPNLHRPQFHRDPRLLDLIDYYRGYFLRQHHFPDTVEEMAADPLREPSSHV